MISVRSPRPTGLSRNTPAGAYVSCGNNVGPGTRPNIVTLTKPR